MSSELESSRQLQTLTGLKPTHFADLVRAAQLIAQPTGGVASRSVQIDWDILEVPPEVVENLRVLGQKYQYELPHIDPSEIWEQLTPASRAWAIDNRNTLWRFEELFPAADED